MFPVLIALIAIIHIDMLCVACYLLALTSPGSGLVSLFLSSCCLSVKPLFQTCYINKDIIIIIIIICCSVAENIFSSDIHLLQLFFFRLVKLLSQ